MSDLPREFDSRGKSHVGPTCIDGHSAERGFETSVASVSETGQATIVRRKAMGQAITNDMGQFASHSSVGPAAMSPITADMIAAMMKGIKTCATSRNFLLIVNFLIVTMTRERKRHRQWILR